MSSIKDFCECVHKLHPKLFIEDISSTYPQNLEEMQIFYKYLYLSEDKSLMKISSKQPYKNAIVQKVVELYMKHITKDLIEQQELQRNDPDYKPYWDSAID